MLADTLLHQIESVAVSPQMIHVGAHQNVTGMTDIHILTVTLFMSEVDHHTEIRVAIRTITKHADMRAIVIKVLGCHRNMDSALELGTLWIMLLVWTGVVATGHQTATQSGGVIGLQVLVTCVSSLLHVFISPRETISS